MTTVVMMVLMMLFVLAVATLLIGEEGVREGGARPPSHDPISSKTWLDRVPGFLFHVSLFC